VAKVELPLFPGYVFVRIDSRQRLMVLGISGVYTILTGAGKALATLPESEIEAFRAGLHLRRPKPHPLLCIGRRVRIRSGALSGLGGVIVRTKSDTRVVLTLNLIRQSVSVEVAGNELELAEECLEAVS
jgi:transcription termination/antitermination protein NusG